jgi:hypothetical protein
MCRLAHPAALALCLTTLVSNQLNARDDGRFANSPLKPWFDRLASGNGLCCSFADGFSVQDVDWDTQDGHYRVRIYGQWYVVPDPAVVTEPNRFGPAVVAKYPVRRGDDRKHPSQLRADYAEVDAPNLLCPSWDTFVRHEFESHNKSLADAQNKKVAVDRHDLVGCGARISTRHAIR